MAPRHVRREKSGGRRPSAPRRTEPGRGLNAFLVGVLAGAGIVLALLAGWHSGSVRPTRPPAAPRASHPTPPQTARPRPAQTTGSAPRHSGPTLVHENPEGSLSPDVTPAPGGPARSDHPRVAVIFDDAGYSLRTAREVMALPRPVTISILPDLPFSTPVAEEAAARRVQVILHLPVQPENPALELGPGGITVDMTDDTIARTVTSDFTTVPGAVGTNNHMGSRGTADPRVMRAILGVVKARHLFFVDSLTSPRSVGAETARALGVPTAVRAVFLDSQDDDTYVRAQFHALIRVAQTRGEAVAIGHVGKVTARVLREMLPEFDEAGIRFVPVSALVR